MVNQRGRILPRNRYNPIIRCPKCGRENYALAVAKGICVWCGFNGRELLNQKKEYDKQAPTIH